MALGGPSGGGDGDEAEGGIFADINITPLTDIFLVLLIIFMVTTTAIAQSQSERGGFKVTLPKGGKGNASAVSDLAVAILADGRVVVGGKVLDQPGLEKAFLTAAAHNPDTMVLIQADEDVLHGRVVEVMDLARREGLTRLGIATRAQTPGG